MKANCMCADLFVIVLDVCVFNILFFSFEIAFVPSRCAYRNDISFCPELQYAFMEYGMTQYKWKRMEKKRIDRDKIACAKARQ